MVGSRAMCRFCMWWPKCLPIWSDSLASQTLSVPQHWSISVSARGPHTESDRRCAERVWPARLMIWVQEQILCEHVGVWFHLTWGGLTVQTGVVDGESIRSGKVPVQSIHPRPTTPSAGWPHLENHIVCIVSKNVAQHFNKNTEL